MQAGKARNYITIEESTFTVDDFGAQVPIWKTFHECWAARRPLTGRESFSMSQMYPTVDQVYQIRYVPGLSNKMRINDDGAYNDIVSITDRDGKKAELTIYTQVFST